MAGRRIGQTVRWLGSTPISKLYATTTTIADTRSKRMSQIECKTIGWSIISSRAAGSVSLAAKGETARSYTILLVVFQRQSPPLFRLSTFLNIYTYSSYLHTTHFSDG